MSDEQWAGSVSADMERIFRRDDLAAAGVARGRAEDERPRGFVIQTPALATDRPSRLTRMLTIVVPVVALAAALFFLVQLMPTISPVAATTPARSAPAAAPARPAPATYRAMAPAEVASVDVAADDDAAAAPRTSPLTAAVRRTRVAAPAAAAPSAAPRRDRCHPGSTENHCIYRDVRAADRRLVAAYRDAADAGVPRAEMVAIRREWTRALAVSLDDPDGTIRTYDDLARRLREAAARMDGRRA